MGKSSQELRKEGLLRPLTLELLKEYVYYNPETEIFTNLKRGKSRPSIGEKVGSLRKDGYRGISIDYKYVLEHRLAWFYMYGYWPEETLDHINEIKDDNRIENLREASLTENNFNVSSYSHNTSGYKGVSFHKGRYRAYISIENKHIHLGYFDTAEEAYEMYCNKVKETRGEFGKL